MNPIKYLKDKISNIKCRLTLALLTALLSATRASAAGNGLSGINEATSMVTSYFDPGTKLVYAIGAVVGLSSAASRFTPNGRVATPTLTRLPPHGSERVSS